MLNELADLGKRIRKPEDHDALKQEVVNADIVIDAQGNFINITTVDKQPTKAEAILSKKGKARLLLDKAEEVLGLEAKKHQLFMQKLEQYRHVPSINPVLLFYGANKANGIEKAAACFASMPEKEKPKGHFAFCLVGEGQRIHEKEDVQIAIVEAFEAQQKANKRADGQLCSLCGTADHPILDQPHGMIKNVPAGQTSGCALVSYNTPAFESYGLAGNDNSSICTACARKYVEGLNYLLNNGVIVTPEKGKPYKQYSNRKNLSADTAMVFWTRNLTAVPELDYVDNTQNNTPSIFAMISATPAPAKEQRDDALLTLLNSPFSARQESLKSVNTDLFYSCMLSGAAARIAVRNWIETTTDKVRSNLAKWFYDIAIVERDFESKQNQPQFFPLRKLAEACAIHRKKEMNGQTQFSLDKEDPFLGRAATILWNCALLGAAPPFTLLDRIVRRIRLEEGRVTPQRVAVLRLVLNRNSAPKIAGGQQMQPQLDTENSNVAYIAGRIFATLERIQTAALGKELNAPLRDRFYSAASTCPAPTFGRLMKLSQAHMGKLRNENKGLHVFLDKQMGELFARITTFPPTFSLEEQGQFAIGYYHQRQASFSDNSKNDCDMQSNDATETSTTGA